MCQPLCPACLLLLTCKVVYGRWCCFDARYDACPRPDRFTASLTADRYGQRHRWRCALTAAAVRNRQSVRRCSISVTRGGRRKFAAGGWCCQEFSANWLPYLTYIPAMKSPPAITARAGRYCGSACRLFAEAVQFSSRPVTRPISGRLCTLWCADSRSCGADAQAAAGKAAVVFRQSPPSSRMSDAVSPR